MGMGGERRSWVRSQAAGPRITSNSDALQAENYLLRQEVLRLRQQLDRLQEGRYQAGWRDIKDVDQTYGVVRFPLPTVAPKAAPAAAASQSGNWRSLLKNSASNAQITAAPSMPSSPSMSR